MLAVRSLWPLLRLSSAVFQPSPISLAASSSSLHTSCSSRIPGSSSKLAKEDTKKESAKGKGRKQESLFNEKQYPSTEFFSPGPGLGIFSPVADKLQPTKPPLMPVWENLESRSLKQLTCREPRTGFEEFIRWTEEGRMHPYPIDNDYGHAEQSVPFHEHVFLEDQLEDGFPKSGPIRHFMELVVNGLSSNPYMTVEKKHGHIAWYREYFQKRGPEIEQLHALDLKHLQALAEIELAAGATPATPSETAQSSPPT